MISTKHPVVAAGAALLFTLSLTSCGGAPTNASEEDFCERVNAAAGEDFGKALNEGNWDRIAELTMKAAKAAEKIGTPEDIPDDAREGWQIQIDAAKNLDGDKLEKDYEASLEDPDAASEDDDPFTADLSDEDKKKVKAYTDYEAETC